MSDFNIEFEENDQQIKLEFEQAGGGAVKSVNGKTGVVVLDADDVGAYTKPSGGIPAGDIASGVVPAVDNTLAISGAAADAKKTGDEISDLKDGLFAAFVTDTASGSIASFSDGADGVPVKSLTVDIEPVQSGSGDPSPTNIRPISGHTQAVVTRTGFNVWDEETSLLGSRLLSSFISVKPNTQYYRVSPNALFPLYFDESKTEISTGTWGTGAFTTPTNCVYLRFQVDPAYGTTYNHDISINYPSTDHDYHAYTGEVYEIDLDGTRYGGTLNVETGVLTVDRKYRLLNGVNGDGVTYNSNGHTTNTTRAFVLITDKAYGTNNMISSSFIYQASGDSVGMMNGRATNNGIEFYLNASVPNTEKGVKAWFAENPTDLVYELAEPLTVQLTANEISTLLGQNNIWNDCGDTTVEYRADTKLYINKMLNA